MFGSLSIPSSNYKKLYFILQKQIILCIIKKLLLILYKNYFLCFKKIFENDYYLRDGNEISFHLFPPQVFFLLFITPVN